MISRICQNDISNRVCYEAGWINKLTIAFAGRAKGPRCHILQGQVVDLVQSQINDEQLFHVVLTMQEATL